MRKKLIATWLVGLLCLLLISNAAWAGIDPPVLKTLDGSLNQISKDSIVTVEDSKFFDATYNSLLIKPYRVQNKISFIINESANYYLQSAFTATVHVRIIFTRANNTIDSISDQPLTINYNPNGTYTSKATYVLSESAYRVQVKVLSATTDVSWNVWRSLQVVNELQSQPQYNFSCSGDAIQQINKQNLAADALIDELPVSWANRVTADEYDLEWAFIDSAALASGRYGSATSPNATLLFSNNATRVTITGTSYKIPLIYDNKGALFFRVRPVQVKTGDIRFEANWSSDYAAGLGRFEYNGHQRKMNWQATTTFAEEGKRKTVVQYFDGSLRGRQTVTKDNTTNNTIVAETKYDYQGRPVLQVLPTPTLNNVIQFSRNFNIGLNGSEYDKDNFDKLLDPSLYCNAGAAAMGTDSGAARYYSSQNPEASTGFNKYIPDAGGYPFTEMEFTQDATGRISRQSGVGANFKLGSGHETKYYYGTPDQKELDALFGTEVGDKSHYFKTMVRDANGQYSVNYSDMHGRTIATALAGSPPDSIKLDRLASNDTATATETLSDPNTTLINNLVMQSQKGLLVSKTGNHSFTYQLNPQSLGLTSCKNVNVCYDCLYDLQITVTDDCNNQRLGGKAFDTVIRNFSLEAIDTTCANAAAGFTVNFSLFLPEGSYDVTKKLSVSRYGMDYYRDSVFVKKNTCKALEQFIQEQRQIVAAQTQCAPTCQSCRDSLNNWDTFRNSFMQKAGIAVADSAGYRDQAWAAWKQALADCDELCGTVSEYDDIRKSMLLDMAPASGQYATTGDTQDKYNIFYSHIDADDNLPDTLPIFNRVTGYLDNNGQPAMVYDEVAGNTVHPYELSADAFAQKFQSSWAEALLPYHPEYCKLQQFEALKASYEWERRFEAVDTYRDALRKGYLNPTNGTSAIFTRYNGYTGSHPDPDPIINVTAYTYKNAIETKLLNYKSVSGGSMNLWTVSNIAATCIGKNNNINCYIRFLNASNCFDSTVMCTGDLDMAWRSFRQLYMEVKRGIVNAQLNSSSVCGNSTPTATQLLTAGHQPHFSDAIEMLTATGSALPNDATAATQQTQAAMNAHYADNCAAYVALWWQQLAPCNYTTADTAVIMPQLRQVCMEGSDASHPMGAGSVRPSSTYEFRSFEDVLRYYNSSSGHSVPSRCNAYLITAPQPYDQQPVYSNKPVYDKPDSCECNQINRSYNYYKAVANQYHSFSDYMQQVYNTTISEADLTQLRNLCSRRPTTCNYLATPIQLPPAFQCGSGDVCIGCARFISVNDEFHSRYPWIVPTATVEPTDSSQLARNLQYQQFMNYRLGFSKTVGEYLDFANACSGVQSCTAPGDTESFLKLYGGNGDEAIEDIQVTADGGFIMAGSTTSFGGGGKDGYVIKTDLYGNLQWSRTYGGESDDDLLRIRKTSDGGYIAIGNSASYSCTSYGPYIDSVAGLMVVKMNAAGMVTWSKYFDMEACDPWTPGRIPGGDVIQTSDGGYAVLINMSGQEICDGFDLGYGNWMLLRLNGEGNELWSQIVHFQNQKGRFYRASLIEDCGGGLLIAGGLGSEGSENTPYQCSLVKLDDSNGSIIWDKTYSFNLSPLSKVKRIYRTLDGGYRIDILIYNDWNYQNGDHLIMEIDANGNFIRSKDFLPSALPDPQSRIMSPTDDGGYAGAEGIAGDPTHMAWHKTDAYGNILGSPFETEGLAFDSLTRMVEHIYGSLAATGAMSGDGLLLRLHSTFIDMTETYNYSQGCWGSAHGLNSSFNFNDYTPYTVTDNTAATNTRGYSFYNMSMAGIAAGTTVTTICSKDACAVSGPTLCGRAAPLMPLLNDSINNCSDSSFFIVSKATELYNAYRDSLSNYFDSSYRARCLQAYKYETFTVTHTANEYHYTLYYYDQAGNLLKTVPPEGVHPNRNAQWLNEVQQARAAGVAKVPDHTLMTQYRYNTMNKVVAQQTPDAGSSNFWYDRLARLVISQDARQKAAGATENNRLYSYTLYDALSRITEVGQVRNATTTVMAAAISRVPASLATWLQNSAANKEQITQTVYDLAYPGFSGITPEPIIQHNLRNRVSYTSFTAGNNTAQYNQATYYSYDIHGNVDTLLQDYGNSQFVANVMNSNNNRFKKTTYKYDLVSGNVNMVSYQPSQPDQLYHRYSYDAENRIILAETSLDTITWEKDARYTYYKHGPLARTVLGDQLVQGIDYAYTLQGWMKGINSTSLKSDYDMGADGKSGAANQYVAKDALSFSLNYFSSDYKPIGFTAGAANTPFPAYSGYLNTAYKPLYNGNISSMTVNIGKFSNPMLYNYTYDQLSRLTAMDGWSGLNETSNSWSALTSLPDYKERISYDANGNIKSCLRNGYGSNLNMDSLTYNYTIDVQGRLINNRLSYVRDRVNNSTSHGSNYTSDIDDQAAANYQFDASGNLIADNQEGITGITWNVYGKITEIQRTATAANQVTNIQYTYDAAGNRISKRVQRSSGTAELTWYVWDGHGNVISVYSSNSQLNSGQLTQTEVHLYGSTRLGIRNVQRNVQSPTAVTGVYTFERGNKYFELNNHLNNVLVTINDKKAGVDASGDGLVEYYNAVIVSAQDYYSFGMQMEGRSFSNAQYRYGFNGKEKDNEVKGEGCQLNYSERTYDPRIGRWFKPDKFEMVAAGWTPYRFGLNNPIRYNDGEGNFEVDAATAAKYPQLKPALKIILEELQKPENSQKVEMLVKMGKLKNKEELFEIFTDGKGPKLSVKDIVKLTVEKKKEVQKVQVANPLTGGMREEEREVEVEVLKQETTATGTELGVPGQAAGFTKTVYTTNEKGDKLLNPDGSFKLEKTQEVVLDNSTVNVLVDAIDKEGNLKKRNKDIFQIFFHTVLHESGHVSDDRKPGTPPERHTNEAGNDFETAFFGSSELDYKTERKRYDYDSKDPKN